MRNLEFKSMRNAEFGMRNLEFKSMRNAEFGMRNSEFGRTYERNINKP